MDKLTRFKYSRKLALIFFRRKAFHVNRSFFFLFFLFHTVIKRIRPLVKSAYKKSVFLFFNQNMYCGYSKEPSQ